MRSLLKSAKNCIPLISHSSSSSTLLTSSARSFGHKCGSFVDQSSLHTASSTLRNVLGDSFKPNVSSIPDSKSRPSCQNSLPSISSAHYSTVENSDGEALETAQSCTASEDSESVDDADGRPDSNYESKLIPPLELQPGFVTSEGTKRYAQRFQAVAGKNHFRTIHFCQPPEEFIISSIGVGNYCGKEMARFDRHLKQLISDSLEKGINIIDTSFLNRRQHSERVIGHGLTDILTTGKAIRDEFFVCTKGGIIPRPYHNLEAYSVEYLNRFVSKGLFQLSDVAYKHCLAPTFLKDQIDCSRRNLGLETIDVYYLQNIEIQINSTKDQNLFYDRLHDAFKFLEQCCDEYKIRMYGISARYENLISPESDTFISLEKIVDLAKSIAGDSHRFKFFQVPVNMARMFAKSEITQSVKGELMSSVDAANALGLYVVSQNSNYFTKPYRPDVDLLNFKPLTIEEKTDEAIKSFQFTRSLEGVGTALFSTRAPKPSATMLDLVYMDS